MPSSSTTAGRLHRLVALLGALVLLPLMVVLSAAPAHAELNSLAGSVQDVLGDDLAGVHVELVDPGVPAGTLDSVTSGADGTFQLDGVDEGSYQLRFVKTGFATTWYGDDGAHAVIVVD